MALYFRINTKNKQLLTYVELQNIIMINIYNKVIEILSDEELRNE